MDQILKDIDVEFVSKYQQIFTEHGIGLFEATGLTHNTLDRIGINNLGHRIRILKNVEFMNNQTSETTRSGPGANADDKSEPNLFQVPQKVIRELKLSGQMPNPGSASLVGPASSRDPSPEKKKKKLKKSSKMSNGRTKVSLSSLETQVEPTPELPLRKADRVDVEPPDETVVVSGGTPAQPSNKLTLGAKPLDLGAVGYGSVEERNKLLADFGFLLGSEAKSRPQDVVDTNKDSISTDDLNWASSASSASKLLLSEFRNKSQATVSTMVHRSFSRYKPPRSHQLEAITKILMDIARNAFTENDTPAERHRRNYLLQHAAGSGKTLTISALVDILYRVIDDSKPTKTRPLFDLIVVVCDRVDLVNQLHGVLTTFLEAQGRDLSILATAQKSADLARYIDVTLNQQDGSPLRIITTTLQKFGKMSVSEGDTKGKRIALVADEAHRSHGKEYTRRMHDLFTGETKQNENVRYFSFTCTPTGHALKAFGSSLKDMEHDLAATRMRPFHTYSLKQAVQDKVVIDVLKNFSSVRIGVDLVAKCSEEKVYNEATSACSTLVRATDFDYRVIAAKARYIVEHFDEVRTKMGKDGFVPKAMLVASSRELVLTYRNAIKSAVECYLPPERRFDAIAVFSPIKEKDDPSKKTIMESDPEVNGFYASPFPSLLGQFQSPRTRVHMIIVADKLQTGFDEPALTAMYVDKPLQGVAAVQTFGRLSRPTKGKDNIFVVDFVNQPSDIVDSFARYWGETTAIVKENNPLDLDDLLIACSCLSAVPGIMTRDSDEFVQYLFDDSRSEVERAIVLKNMEKIRLISAMLQIDVGLIPVSLVNRLHSAVIAEGKRRLAEANRGAPHGGSILDDVEVHAGSAMAVTKEEALNIGNLPGSAQIDARGAYAMKLSRYLERDAPSMSLKEIMDFVDVVKKSALDRLRLESSGASITSSEGFNIDSVAFLRSMDEMEVDQDGAGQIVPAEPSSDSEIFTPANIVDFQDEDSDGIEIVEDPLLGDHQMPMLYSPPSPKRRKVTETNTSEVSETFPAEPALSASRQALRKLQALSVGPFPQAQHAMQYRECFYDICIAMENAEDGSDIEFLLRESEVQLVDLASQVLRMDQLQFEDTVLQAIRFLESFFSSWADDAKTVFPYGELMLRASHILQRPGPIQTSKVASQTLKFINLLLVKVSDDAVGTMIAHGGSALRNCLANSFCSYMCRTEDEKRIASIAIEVIYKCGTVDYDFLRHMVSEVQGFKGQINLKAENFTGKSGNTIRKVKNLLDNPLAFKGTSKQPTFRPVVAPASVRQDSVKMPIEKKQQALPSPSIAKQTKQIDSKKQPPPPNRSGPDETKRTRLKGSARKSTGGKAPKTQQMRSQEQPEKQNTNPNNPNNQKEQSRDQGGVETHPVERNEEQRHSNHPIERSSMTMSEPERRHRSNEDHRRHSERDSDGEYSRYAEHKAYLTGPRPEYDRRRDDFDERRSEFNRGGSAEYPRPQADYERDRRQLSSSEDNRGSFRRLSFEDTHWSRSK